jgi:hypothetical protein
MRLKYVSLRFGIRWYPSYSKEWSEVSLALKLMLSLAFCILAKKETSPVLNQDFRLRFIIRAPY